MQGNKKIVKNMRNYSVQGQEFYSSDTDAAAGAAAAAAADAAASAASAATVCIYYLI